MRSAKELSCTVGHHSVSHRAAPSHLATWSIVPYGYDGSSLNHAPKVITIVALLPFFSKRFLTGRNGDSCNDAGSLLARCLRQRPGRVLVGLAALGFRVRRRRRRLRSAPSATQRLSGSHPGDRAVGRRDLDEVWAR